MSNAPCPTDSALWPVVMGDSLPRELQQHLENCISCQQRVTAIRGDVQAVRSVDWDSVPTETAGKAGVPLPESIGEYTILARLGAGGQADVYRAWHPRLKTDVVIKWFRHSSFPNVEPAQLSSEARVLSTIRHPYLAQVFDVGIEQGRHYIIMEFVSGQTFSDWIRLLKPTIPRIAVVLSKAASAVDAVHQHGALHLDLKPDNILVDDEGNPRVIDFGMARYKGCGSQRSLVLAPGTPEYMSPEQYAGDTGRISTATDVYGLGAVLFSALSQQPVRAAEKMALEPDWSLIRHAPWRLRRICRRALATQPQDRYESAATIAMVLRRFATKQTIARRSLSVAAVIAGIFSLYLGITAARSEPLLASLEIQSHRRNITENQSVFETKCSAVLAEQRAPCIVIASATTNAVRARGLVKWEDADWRIACMASDQDSIQVADEAGPHVIMACAEHEWNEAPSEALNTFLKALQVLPLKHGVSILFDNQQVSLLAVGARIVSSEESSHRQSALATVQQMQSRLGKSLPGFSGIVVIPPRGLLLATTD